MLVVSFMNLEGPLTVAYRREFVTLDEATDAVRKYLAANGCKTFKLRSLPGGSWCWTARYKNRATRNVAVTD